MEVIEHGENWLQIAVSKEDEPIPLQEEEPVFKYKDKFYQVIPLWVTYGLPENAEQLIAGPCGLELGWGFTGALFLKDRKSK